MDDRLNITVIIPTYNRKTQLKRCLESLRGQSIAKQFYEIIIIDDGSSDETHEVGKFFVELSQGHIKYIRQKNQGPAGARNRGIDQAEGTIIAFIDDDCRAEKVWLEELIKGYEDKGVGGTGGRIVSPLKETLADCYCAHVGLLETPKIKRNRVEYVITANASFRKSVLKEIGCFTESFTFPGGEDPDLSDRVVKAGYRLLYNPSAVVYHYHRRTTATLRKTFFNYGMGKAIFLLKNKKGFLAFLYQVFSLGWFFLLALKNTPSYLYATRGLKGFSYAFFDVYIRTVFRVGLIVGYFKYRQLFVQKDTSKTTSPL